MMDEVDESEELTFYKATKEFPFGVFNKCELLMYYESKKTGISADKPYNMTAEPSFEKKYEPDPMPEA
eukprot:CAMPEP_0114579796 /NCGR_PEP_ID=MMETSP0125-20121206/4153_1 /TAXON_ID=485358 ORGANISM="Aristerostoma sp., Strain ATCC 50986" /NCGR_SAMPLE_ID=MMETSP0125 /ASSEMBLY_ACC=CAM_ASM_000245 /LENGTH=67 /DNA_ID=CAMNT_0001770859 /DNA_START=422 /DNA_END=625 /DNA_ORIENTATION=-